MTHVTTQHEPRPTTPPEWTPLPGPVPPATPDQPPARPPTLPMILAPGPSAEDVTTQLLRHRVVMLTGPLGRTAADDAAAKLLLLDRQGHDEITLHLSCPDADLEAALDLAAAIDLLQSPVHAIAAGSVVGAALAVVAACSRRTAHPHATFVLAEPRTDLQGDAEQLRIAAEQHRRRIATLGARIAKATGRDDDVARDLAHGRLLTADEAADYGLVQSVTDRG